VTGPLVCVASARDLPAGDAWLQPGERAALARLRAPRRRRDFRLGRFAARKALGLCAGRLSPDGGRVEVRPAAGGAPVAWQDGARLPVTLSISHSDGWAAAGIEPGGGRLGCDLEHIEGRSRAFVHDYFSPDERRLVDAGADARERALRATLVWCAKEAVMKALGEGLRLPPLAVSVCPSFAAASASGWRPFTIGRPRAAADLAGSWRRIEGFVLAVAGETSEPRLAFPGPFRGSSA
jgi:4'-phosphopantetheinyl transferase